jgi:AraC-like DNA-binding protein
MDALSDVLKSVHLEGAVYLNAEFSAPWCIRGCYGVANAKERLAGADHISAPTTLVRELLQTGVRESSIARPGTRSILAKLSELMFAEALRRYVESLPHDGEGWLAGVRDVHVGRALALMHGQPDRAWTVEALAREVALSRSALADRFTMLVGEPPMQYLMRWRLARAAQRLRSGREPIVRVAERSGYDSEAAFSRAFKREFNVPPGAWRRRANPA